MCDRQLRRLGGRLVLRKQDTAGQGHVQRTSRRQSSHGTYDLQDERRPLETSRSVVSGDSTAPLVSLSTSTAAFPLRADARPRKRKPDYPPEALQQARPRYADTKLCSAAKRLRNATGVPSSSSHPGVNLATITSPNSGSRMGSGEPQRIAVRLDGSAAGGGLLSPTSPPSSSLDSTRQSPADQHLHLSAHPPSSPRKPTRSSRGTSAGTRRAT